MTRICKENNPNGSCCLFFIRPDCFSTWYCTLLHEDVPPFEALLAFILPFVMILYGSLAFGQATPSLIIDNAYVTHIAQSHFEHNHIHPMNECKYVFRMSSVDVNWTSILLDHVATLQNTGCACDPKFTQVRDRSSFKHSRLRPANFSNLTGRSASGSA